MPVSGIYIKITLGYTQCQESRAREIFFATCAVNVIERSEVVLTGLTITGNERKRNRETDSQRRTRSLLKDGMRENAHETRGTVLRFSFWSLSLSSSLLIVDGLRPIMIVAWCLL